MPAAILDEAQQAEFNIPPRRDPINEKVVQNPRDLVRLLTTIADRQQSASIDQVTRFRSLERQAVVITRIARQGGLSLTPSTATRNLIRPDAPGGLGIGVRAHATQSADLIRAENSAGSALFRIGSDGKQTLAAGASINEFSVDGTLGDNSDLAVPTEQAVKTYVDSQIAGAVHKVATVGPIDLTATTPQVLYTYSGSGTFVPAIIVMRATTLTGSGVNPEVSVQVRNASDVDQGNFVTKTTLGNPAANAAWARSASARIMVLSPGWDIELTPETASTFTEFSVTVDVLGYEL